MYKSLECILVRVISFTDFQLIKRAFKACRITGVSSKEVHLMFGISCFLHWSHVQSGLLYIAQHMFALESSCYIMEHIHSLFPLYILILYKNESKAKITFGFQPQGQGHFGVMRLFGVLLQHRVQLLIHLLFLALAYKVFCVVNAHKVLFVKGMGILGMYHYFNCIFSSGYK